MTIDLDEARAIARSSAATEDYRSGPVPDETMSELGASLLAFAHVPFASRNILAEHLAPGTDIDEMLEASWGVALDEGAVRFYDNKVIFPLCALRADGRTPIEASIRKGDPERSAGKPWHLCFVNTYVKPPLACTAPSKALEQFAWLGPWEEFLGQLAACALPEAWDFGGPDEHGHRFVILKSYLCTTFYRLSVENKVRITEDRSFAAFNTGLVDRRYDDIFACFEPGYGTFEWKFAGFAASGNRRLKKRVAGYFSPLPEAARYVDRLEDLLFDLDRELVVDYEHILLDNIGRLPTSFLADELRGCAEAEKALQTALAAAPNERNQALEELADIIDTDSRLFRQLRNRIEDAVDVARRRVRWNFKTAIPCYYPRADAMSLLLPLCLTSDDAADAALVVQLSPSGSYQGQTILTMRQAYMNARLICRPDSDWLTTLRPDEMDTEPAPNDEG